MYINFLQHVILVYMAFFSRCFSCAIYAVMDTLGRRQLFLEFEGLVILMKRSNKLLTLKGLIFLAK